MRSKRFAARTTHLKVICSLGGKVEDERSMEWLCCPGGRGGRVEGDEVPAGELYLLPTWSLSCLSSQISPRGRRRLEISNPNPFVEKGRFWCHLKPENCDFCPKYCTFENLSRNGFVLRTLGDLETLVWPPGGSEQLRLWRKGPSVVCG